MRRQRKRCILLVASHCTGHAAPIHGKVDGSARSPEPEPQRGDEANLLVCCRFSLRLPEPLTRTRPGRAQPGREEDVAVTGLEVQPRAEAARVQAAAGRAAASAEVAPAAAHDVVAPTLPPRHDETLRARLALAQEPAPCFVVVRGVDNLSQAALARLGPHALQPL